MEDHSFSPVKKRLLPNWMSKPAAMINKYKSKSNLDTTGSIQDKNLVITDGNQKKTKKFSKSTKDSERTLESLRDLIDSWKKGKGEELEKENARKALQNYKCSDMKTILKEERKNTGGVQGKEELIDIIIDEFFIGRNTSFQSNFSQLLHSAPSPKKRKRSDSEDDAGFKLQLPKEDDEEEDTKERRTSNDNLANLISKHLSSDSSDLKSPSPSSFFVSKKVARESEMKSLETKPEIPKFCLSISDDEDVSPPKKELISSNRIESKEKHLLDIATSDPEDSCSHEASIPPQEEPGLETKKFMEEPRIEKAVKKSSKNMKKLFSTTKREGDFEYYSVPLPSITPSQHYHYSPPNETRWTKKKSDKTEELTSIGSSQSVLDKLQFSLFLPSKVETSSKRRKKAKKIPKKKEMIICPLCSAEVIVQDDENEDTAISNHLDEDCYNKTPKKDNKNSNPSKRSKLKPPSSSSSSDSSVSSDSMTPNSPFNFIQPERVL